MQNMNLASYLSLSRMLSHIWTAPHPDTFTFIMNAPYYLHTPSENNQNIYYTESLNFHAKLIYVINIEKLIYVINIEKLIYVINIEKRFYSEDIFVCTYCLYFPNPFTVLHK